MVFGCGNNMVKAIVVFVNFLLCIGGGLVFGLSLYAKLSPDFNSEVTKILSENDVELSTTTNVLYGLVFLGGVTFLLGFLGCAGACCESPCLLMFYFIAILVIVIAQVGLVIAAFVKKGDVKTEIQKGMQKVKDDDAENWNKITKDLQCDSVDSCTNKVYDSLTGKIPLAAGIGAGVLAIELVAMCFACILRSAINGPRYYA